MVTYLLKKSYQLKDLKQIEFQDLWGDHGIFTTMWIFGKPAKILFFDNHLKNLILSLKKYQIKKKSLRSDILEIINKNLYKKRKYNHLLRIAINKKVISISLRKRVKPKLNFKNISEISVASGVVVDSNANHEFNENFLKAKALIDLFK